VNEGLIEVEDDKFVKTWFFKLEVYILTLKGLWLLLDLLNDVDRLENVDGHVLID
jgi:hypothetical protein